MEEKAVGMPVGVGDGAVDQQVPEGHEDQHGSVLHAIGKTTTY